MVGVGEGEKDQGWEQCEGGAGGWMGEKGR